MSSPHYLLAQASATSGWQAAEHAALIATICGVLIMWLTYRRKRETRRIEPQPFEIRMAADMVRKDECIRTHAESMAGMQDIRADLSNLRTQRVIDAKDSGSSREKMYLAIKDVRIELSSSQDQIRRDMARGFQDIERSIGRLEGKLNGNP